MQEVVYEGRREPFANVKELQNVIRDKWHDVDDDQTVRKAILKWKRYLADVFFGPPGIIFYSLLRLFYYTFILYFPLFCSLFKEINNKIKQ